MSPRGRSGYAVLVAAVLGLVTACGGSRSHGASPTALPDPTAAPSQHASAHASSSPSSGPHLLPTQLLYYLGPEPVGPLLHHVTMIRTPGSHASDNAMYGLEEAPDDRRLHSYWKPGWLSGVKRGAGTIDVELGAAPATRPPGMDEATAEASVQ